MDNELNALDKMIKEKIIDMVSSDSNNVIDYITKEVDNIYKVDKIKEDEINWEELKVNINILKNASLKFLKYYKLYEYAISARKHYNALKRNEIENYNPKEDLSIIKEYENSENNIFLYTIREFKPLLLMFYNRISNIQEYMDKELIAYVHYNNNTGKDVIPLDEIKSVDMSIYEYNTFREFSNIFSLWSGRVRNENLKYDSKSKIKQSSTIEEQKKFETAKAAYVASLNRLSRSTGGTKLKYIDSNKKWNTVRVSNKGILKEGYANVIYAKNGSKEVLELIRSKDTDDKLGGNVNLYGYHTFIRLFTENFLTKVDNESWLLSEDINGSISVKSENARLGSLAPFYSIANIIVNSSASTLSSLKREITNRAKTDSSLGRAFAYNKNKMKTGYYSLVKTEMSQD